MMHNRLHVSLGNEKLGKRTTANVSLLPVVTCPEGVPCAKECYARRLAINKETIAAWLDNTAFAVNDPAEFIRDVWLWVDKHRPAFFRWHTAGDIPSFVYQSGMIEIATDFPETRFLVFTKCARYTWDRLANLAVFWSAWPGDGIDGRWIVESRGMKGVAWQEGDERIPEGATPCKGRCDKCRWCWLTGVEGSEAPQHLVLHKH